MAFPESEQLRHLQVDLNTSAPLKIAVAKTRIHEAKTALALAECEYELAMKHYDELEVEIKALGGGALKKDR